jgi:hypothetical protein
VNLIGWEASDVESCEAIEYGSLLLLKIRQLAAAPVYNLKERVFTIPIAKP